MAAAWNFSRSAQKPVTRLVSALSLDGMRLASELAVRFTRSLASDTAESLANEAARVAAEILGEQIAQGKVPLSRTEFLQQIEDRTAQTVGKAAELRVVALYLVAEESAAHSTSRTRVPLVPPSSHPPAPLTVSAPPAVSSSSASGQHAIAIPSSVRTLWRLALSGCQPGVEVAQLGHLLGPALRDSAAAAIFRAAEIVDPTAFDRMALFDPRSQALGQLRREACACFLAALYRVLVSGHLQREVINQVIEAAGAGALRPDTLPHQDIGRYAASEAPVRDLAARFAAILESPKDARDIQNALTPYCEHLRTDLVHVVHEVRRLRGVA